MMIDNEKMLLNWTEHTANAPNTFKQLWGDQDFADVTLATADHQQIQAHKVIISSCSQFFRNILVKNPHANPLIYLKGIRHKELEMVLKCIYLGECEVENSDLRDFLAVGADLEITGLVTPQNHQGLDQMAESQDESEQIDTEVKEYDVSSPVAQFKCDLCDKEYKHRGNLDEHKKAKHEGIRYICDQCGYKSAKQSNLTAHKKAKHEGLMYYCGYCDYKVQYQDSLNRHKQAKHEGMKYACDICDFKTISQFSLVDHIQVKHEGVTYDCDQCDYKSTRVHNLKTHKQAMHEHTRYKCDQCEFETSKQDSLKGHIKSEHEGVRYPCDQCDLKYTTQRILSRHKQVQHEGIRL
jgi:predicted RNA-binding Zn-ribbon protein involved in translation (DUF1610 family)